MADAKHGENLAVHSNVSKAGASSSSAGKAVSASEVPDDMTVQQYLDLQCKDLVDGVNGYADGLITKLRESYDARKDAFLQEARSGDQALAAKVADSGSGGRGANTMMKKSKKVRLQLKLDVSSGVYDKQSFLVTIEAGKQTLVGRAKSRAYTKGGLSLPKDEEVSTKHGCFQVDAATKAVSYTDLESTNGSSHNDQALEPNVPVKLVEGDKLLVGSNVVHITTVTEM